MPIKENGGTVLGRVGFLNDHKIRRLTPAGFTTFGFADCEALTNAIDGHDGTNSCMFVPGKSVDIFVGYGDDSGLNKLAAGYVSHGGEGVETKTITLPHGLPVLIAAVPDTIWVDPSGRTQAEIEKGNRYGGLGWVIDDARKLWKNITKIKPK
jgi:hypothetical protein